jgi:hypothetical protein
MSTPCRIQLKRTKGWKMPPNTVKVDRTTGFGNPFPVIKGASISCGVTKPCWRVGTWDGPAMWYRDSAAEAQKLAVDAYRSWVNQPAQSLVRDKARVALRGKNLGCWCKPGDPCHADVLLEIANAVAPTDGAVPK